MSNTRFMDTLLDGVEVQWMPLGCVLYRTKGTKITAGKMKTLHKDGAPLKVFAGGKTVAYVDFADIPATDVNREPSIVVKSRGIIEFEYYDQPFTHKNEMWSYHSKQSSITTKYLFHYLKRNEVHFHRMAERASMPQISISDTEDFLVPIPCPSDPKRSLEIQAQIVRILDTFTKLTAELTAELTARKKQYNYYRDQLLCFDDGNVEWKTLGDVCDFKNGFAFKSNLFKDFGLPIVRITNVNGTSVDLSDVKYFNPDDYKENTQAYIINQGDILIAMSGATTGKIGYFDSYEVAYLNQRVGKFVPNPELLNNRFLYHFLLSKTEAIYVLAGGGAQPNLSSKVLMEKLLVPIPHADDPAKSIPEQKKIADVLDKLDALTNSITEGLPREIQLRQKQYEYYRDLLLSFPKPDDVATGSNDD
jgi:type I restriction enzyme S subunit